MPRAQWLQPWTRSGSMSWSKSGPGRWHLGKHRSVNRTTFMTPQSKAVTKFTQSESRRHGADNCAGGEEGRTDRAMAERSMFSLDDSVSGMGCRERYWIPSSCSFLTRWQDQGCWTHLWPLFDRFGFPIPCVLPGLSGANVPALPDEMFSATPS